jgi:hypothetical protein
MNRHRKILTCIAVALGAAIVLAYIHHLWLRESMEGYIAQLKAQGEPMNLAQVLPPPVPPEQNGADIFRKAVALLDADTSLLQTNYVFGMEMVARGKAMICWQQPDVRNVRATNSWQDIAAAVAQNEKAYALLHQIIAKPDFDFRIKYEKGAEDIDLNHLDLLESKRAAQRLEAAALCDLHQGDTASAVENLRTILALVKAMRAERLDVSELMRMAMADMAFAVNWEVLQSTNLTAEQLAELQKDWTSLNFIQSYENMLKMRRVLGCITADKWRSSESGLQNLLEPGVLGQTASSFSDSMAPPLSMRANIAARVFMWCYWWSYPDEMQMLRGYQISLAAARLAGTNYSFRTAIEDQRRKLEMIWTNESGKGWETIFDHGANVHQMLSSSVTPLTAILERVMMTETAKQMAITANALKRYQLKHGKYPPDLNSLVRDFISRIPRDPVNGQPLHYRRNADGTFLLYSVGENGRDDGGNPALKPNFKSSDYYWLNSLALDWVWPQPATPEEVQNYYAHLPK